MPDGRPAFLLVDGRRETRRKMGEAGKSLGRGATARTRKPASLSIRREPSGRNKPATCSGSKTERYRDGRRTGTAVGARACPSRSVSTISMRTSVETRSRESQMRFFGLPTYAFVRPAYCCANHAWPSGSGLWARNRSHLCIAWQKFDAAFGPIAVTVGGGKD